jgi:hypothetical protein
MINKRAGIRAMRRGLLAVFLVLTISSASQAGPLDIVIEPYPVITAGFITSTYNATTGAFFASGWALTLDTGLAPQTTITTPFRLAATIDSATGRATNGNVVIGNTTSPLLSGLTLLGFAFTAVQGGTLEFLFGDTGGSYVPGIFPNKPIDVMLVTGSTFLGNFNTSWNSSSNTATIRDPDPPTSTPEPSTLLLMVAGAGALFRQIRKRRA